MGVTLLVGGTAALAAAAGTPVPPEGVPPEGVLVAVVVAELSWVLRFLFRGHLKDNNFRHWLLRLYGLDDPHPYIDSNIAEIYHR